MEGPDRTPRAERQHESAEPRSAEGPGDDRARRILATITDGYVRLDRDWIIREVNAAAAQFVERERHELVDRRYLDVFPEARGTDFEREYRRALDSRRPVHFEAASSLPTGRFSEVHVYPGDDGGLEIYFRDITDRKRAEQERDRFFDMSADLLAVASLSDGRWKRINRAFTRVLGCRETELLEKPILDAVHPEDRQGTEQVIAALSAGEKTRSVENRLTCSDGDTRWIAWEISRDPETGLLYCTGRDVTERRAAEEALRQSEQRLQLALRLTGSTAFAQDRDLRYTWVYSARRPASLAELVGRTDHELLPPDQAAAVVEPKQQVIATGEPLRTEVRVVLGGKARYFDLVLEPMRDQSGTVYGLMGATVDITGHRRTEQRLRELAGELEDRVRERTATAEQRTAQLRVMALQLTQAEERERQHLAQVLHDGLQQLLVAGQLELQRLAFSPRDRQGLAADTERLRTILQEAIEESRSLAYELSPPVLRKHGLAPALSWLARDVQRKHGLEVSLDVPEELELPEEQAVFLFQAVRELLFNASKHARVGRVQLVARQEPMRLLLDVQDNGVGFDPRPVEAGPEAGFGLFSVRERAEVFGGGLEIESAPGLGSRFRLWLPLSPPAATRSADTD
ncbi:MAG: PAS domain-containing protein [Candidatus Krumholzibacteriia bacterium]